MTIKILKLEITKDESAKLNFSDMVEILNSAEEIDSAETERDNIQLFSFVNGPEASEYHGFTIGKTLVCVDSVELIIAMIGGLKTLARKLAKRSPLMALKMIMAMAEERGIADGGINKSSSDLNIDKTLEDLFDSVKEPKNPDA